MIKPRLWIISLYVAGSTDLASSVIAKILLHFFQSLAYDIISILHGLGDIHRRLFLIPILLLLWFIMVECAIYLYSYKATRTMKTNYNNIWRVNLVPSSLRVALPPSPTHTHTVKWKRVFPCFRFTLGSRIRLHVGSPRGTSERIGRREEACGTMWERDFWRAIAYLLYVKCDQEILGRVNQRAALL